DHNSHSGPTEFTFPANARGGFLDFRSTVPPTGPIAQNPPPTPPALLPYGDPTPGILRPGGTYDILLQAISSRGVSGNTGIVSATLTVPSITVGNPDTGNVSTPSAYQSFGLFDANGNGIVDQAVGANGNFPFFPSNVGSEPAAQAGIDYASLNGMQANVI